MRKVYFRGRESVKVFTVDFDFGIREYGFWIPLIGLVFLFGWRPVINNGL